MIVATLKIAAKTQQQLRGVACLYKRTTGAEIPLTLVPGRKLYALERNGARFYHRHADWIAIAAELLDDDAPFVPARGDVIVATFEGNEVQFEVLPESGLPTHEFLDPYQVAVRIHSKLVSA